MNVKFSAVGDISRYFYFNCNLNLLQSLLKGHSVQLNTAAQFLDANQVPIGNFSLVQLHDKNLISNNKFEVLHNGYDDSHFKGSENAYSGTRLPNLRLISLHPSCRQSK
jgi:hypothetical protein